MLVLLVIAAGCVSTQQYTSMDFKGGNGRCAGGPAEFNASRSGGQLSFSGSIDTSNPCYYLNASHSVSGDVVTVSITTRYKTGIGTCIMCIGTVPFEGNITGLSDMPYNFIIAEGDNILFEKKV